MVFSGIGALIGWGFVLLVIGAELRSCVLVRLVVDRKSTQENNNSFHIVSLQESVNPPKAAIAQLHELWQKERMPNEPEIYIVESKDINAASIGHGRFLLWSGLMSLRLESQQAIIAHELAHDRLKHSQHVSDLSDLASFFGEAIAFIGGSSREGTETLTGWMNYAALPKYSRTQEFDADQEAVELLRQAGSRDPRKQMVNALRQLMDQYGNTGGHIFDSHPSTIERITRLDTIS